VELQWTTQSDPYSSLFDDIYYAEESGLEESRYVFLLQNGCAEKFSTNEQTVIGELGFGTGLNFFATFDLWRKTSRPNASWLHYISCEKFPLSPEQIRKALSRWPEISHLVELFLEKYQNYSPGFHRIRFERDRLTLTLLIGDASQSLKQLRAKIDAWYFDGFSPRKNPEMWSEEIFQEVAKLSNPGATFATYAAAGFVRRHIQMAGFSVEKFKGFGRKKDMVKGRIEKPAVAIRPRSTSAIVIGGGIAGVSTAAALAKRGCKVYLLERESIAARASKNQSANTLPSLTKKPTSLSRFSWAGFFYLRNQTQLHGDGIVQLVQSEEKLERYKQSLQHLQLPSAVAHLIDAQAASDTAKVELQNDALYLPTAGHLDIPQFCDGLLKESGGRVQVLTEFAISRIERSTGLWRAYSAEGTVIEADEMILAAAHSISNLVPPAVLPLRKVRGQAALISCKKLSALATTLCFDGFVTPKLTNHFHFLGATYDNESTTLEVCESDNDALVEKLCRAIPSISRSDIHLEKNWVEYRTNVPGMDPVLGRLNAMPGAPYIATAFSSRGTLYAPLAGEVIASDFYGEPSPLENDLLRALSPDRFA
jgi:tRNA 5-methylaminomethyl-2-thiouridine biosynthesis bifunctional protein